MNGSSSGSCLLLALAKHDLMGRGTTSTPFIRRFRVIHSYLKAALTKYVVSAKFPSFEFIQKYYLLGQRQRGDVPGLDGKKKLCVKISLTMPPRSCHWNFSSYANSRSKLHRSFQHSTLDILTLYTTGLCHNCIHAQNFWDSKRANSIK